MSYAEFLASKGQVGQRHGFEPTFLPGALFPFQRDLVRWAVRQGRGAIFADCGLGKTLMQLSWAPLFAGVPTPTDEDLEEETT